MYNRRGHPDEMGGNPAPISSTTSSMAPLHSLSCPFVGDPGCNIPSPFSTFHVGIQGTSSEGRNPWGGLSSSQLFLPHTGPYTTMAHVPRSLAASRNPNMTAQNEGYRSIPNLSLSLPREVYNDVYGSFPTQPSQLSISSSMPPSANSLSMPTPYHSTSFVGFRTPASLAATHPPGRLISPLFSSSRNKRSEEQCSLVSPSDADNLTEKNLNKFYLDAPMKPSLMSSYSDSSRTTSSATQASDSLGIDNSYGSPSSWPPPNQQLPSSSLPSAYSTHYSPQPAIDNSSQGEGVVHGNSTVNKEPPIPQAASQTGMDYTDCSTLQGEIEKDQNHTFNQSSKTGPNASSKEPLAELDEFLAQRSGRRPPAGCRGWTRRSKKRKPVVRKKAEPDYSVKYANTQKSSPYPEGLQWVPSLHVGPLDGSPTGLWDPAASSLPAHEPQNNDEGTLRRGSGEPPDTEHLPSVTSTGSPPSPERKRKQEGGEATHSSSPASSSSMQAPPAKRQKPRPKEMVEHRIEICEGWEASTFGPPVEKEPFIPWKGPPGK